MSESQSASRSRLELARDAVDRVFGPGHAAAHPSLSLPSCMPHRATGRRGSRVAVRGARATGRPCTRMISAGAHYGL